MKPLKLNTYFDLCTQVYDLSKTKPDNDAYTFYKEYISNAKDHILEPMCGSGRFLLPLLEEGFDIQGFDASDFMLQALHVKAKLKNIKPNVWKDFIENFKRSERYNLIFIPGGSFGLITDIQSAKMALKIFYDHLACGGILLFEGETLKASPSQFNIWEGSVWRKKDGNTIIASNLNLPLNDNVCNFVAKYELVKNNNIVHTEIEELKVRFYNPEDLVKMLKDVGFKNIKMIKAFNGMATPNEDDKMVIYECQK